MKTAWRRLPLLILLGALALSARAATPAETAVAEIRQLLEWVGALALLEQARPVAQLVLKNEAAQPASQPSKLALEQQRALLQRFDARLLQRQLIERITTQLQPEARAQLHALLQQPLAKRVRFFERALTQQNVEEEWQQWREQTPAPASTRVELLRAIDEAAHDSKLTAELQTAVEAAVRRQLGGGADIANSLQAEALTEREHHLQVFTEQYLLYAYRYLRDDELRQYAELLQNTTLQQFLGQVGEGVVTVVADATK